MVAGRAGLSFSDADRLALRAALAPGPVGREAFAAWSGAVDLDSAGAGTYRLAPILYRRALEFDYRGPLLPRLRGMTRHVWLSNAMRLRMLPEAVELLSIASPVVLLKGAATALRLGEAGQLRPMGDVDVLVRRSAFRDCCAALEAAGWRAQAVDLRALTETDLTDLHAISFARAPHETLDLHWSPLREIADPRLTEEILAASAHRGSGAASFPVPSMLHHMFLLLLHGSAATREGRVDWVAEAALMIGAQSSPGGSPAVEPIDWKRLFALARRYAFDHALHRTLVALQRDLGLSWRFSSGRTPSVAPLQRAEAGAAASTGVLATALREVQAARRREGIGLGRSLRLVATTPAGRARWAFRLLAAAATGSPQDAARAYRWGCAAAAMIPKQPPGKLFMAGWSFPEAEGRWTDGRLAVLALHDRARAGERALLRFRVTPFLPEPASTLDVAVHTGLEQRVWRFRERQGHAARLLRHVAASFDGRGCAVVAFAIDRPRAPIDHRKPLDERELGLLLDDISLSSDRATQATYDLRRGGEGAGRVSQGWSDPEPRGTWTDGPCARANLEIPSESFGKLWGRLRIEAAHASRPGQRVLVTADGEMVSAVSLDPIAQRVPTILEFGPFATHGRAVALAIRIEGPLSPLELGAGSDPRALGLMVSEIVLSAEPPEAAESETAQTLAEPRA